MTVFGQKVRVMDIVSFGNYDCWWTRSGLAALDRRLVVGSIASVKRTNFRVFSGNKPEILENAFVEKIFVRSE
jgi:hypothetical protein